MSGHDDIQEESTEQRHGRPYTAKHPVPTVRGYREHRAEVHEREQQGADGDEEDEVDQERKDEAAGSKVKRALDSVKAIAKDDDLRETNDGPYRIANRNCVDRAKKQEEETAGSGEDGRESDTDTDGGGIDRGKQAAREKDKRNAQEKFTTQVAASSTDPREKRRAMKKHKRHGAGREVTDPVTHLPVMIHDMTTGDLESTPPEDEPAPPSDHRYATGWKGASKSRAELGKEHWEVQKAHNGMRKLFPPPDLNDMRRKLEQTYRAALFCGLGAVSLVTIVALLVIALLLSRTGSSKRVESGWLHRPAESQSRVWPWLSTSVVLVVAAAGVSAIVATTSGWVANRVDNMLQDEMWDASRREEERINASDVELPESVAWLNSLLASVWQLINPDLFTSLTDTLEDVMQASLPKVIRMVSVDDMGQGSEAIRILGIRWLPTGAAGQSVDSAGHLRPAHDNDRTSPGDGQIDSAEDKDDSHAVADGGKDAAGKPAQDRETEQERQAVAEGMEGEEGNFVNMELAFAYRTRSTGKSVESKAKNAHLYLKFYLPGAIAVPVWVELRGMIGIMRLRLQLTPDPPFFSLCTLTFLGQPRVDLSCVPLSRHSLNIMDFPLISSFVQSSIDAAFAEYVAPKSLTLDLKSMVVGDDFKTDTVARGVVLIYIKRAQGFKEGDGHIGPFSGSSDPYVTVSWGKVGKPIASTRIIADEQKPVWNEWASLLVSAEELNADETIRLQLWDSDKYTADDDLGRVEINLKTIMRDSKTKNNMCDRDDEFRGEDPEEKMPGTLSWSVGYFSKSHIQPCQLEKQNVDAEIHNTEQLKTWAEKKATAKLREASSSHDEHRELHQQTVRDFKEREDGMIISTPPPNYLPSGILSIQIHNITGLEVSRPNRRSGDDDEDREDEAEQSANLPDSYCTIMLNHAKIYRTRTKPKNAKPFFNAGTERFVRDWRTAEVMVAVRDSREHENDPLLGVIYLPLRRVFARRSQVMESFPLAGGIGYGRARISMVWRSVDAQLPRALLGWDYGTIEVWAPVRLCDGSDEQLASYKIRMQTRIGQAKMYGCSDEGGRGCWRPKNQERASVFLGVVKRYATALVLEFRQKAITGNTSPAVGALWLGDLPDEEETTVRVPVWRGGTDAVKRARSCADYSGQEEGEKPLGEVEMAVRFWRGLSGYHKTYAGKARNGHMRDVMEVLDTVNEEKMAEEDTPDNGNDGGGDDSSDTATESDADENDERNGPQSHDSCKDNEKRKMLCDANSSTSSDNSKGGSVASSIKSVPSRLKKRVSNMLDGDEEAAEQDGRRGPVAQASEYKRHYKQLHRRHRGVMQWKTARTLDWAAGKVSLGRAKVAELFEHGNKDCGVETEV